MVGYKSEELTDKQCMLWANRAKELSNCKSNQIGCIIVTTDNKVGIGYNEAPISISNCKQCPRKEYESGERLDLCRAIHAEMKALLLSLKCNCCGGADGAILYTTAGIPCKNCMIMLIESGIKRIVVSKMQYYDELSKELVSEWIENGGILDLYDM